MLKMNSHNVNVYGESTHEGKMLASFNASSYGQEMSININSISFELSEAEKEIFYADIKSFCESAMEKMALMAE